MMPRNQLLAILSLADFTGNKKNTKNSEEIFKDSYSA
jgi:hypothetical protein